jgi:hypothetical protein
MEATTITLRHKRNAKNATHLILFKTFHLPKLNIRRERMPYSKHGYASLDGNFWKTLLRGSILLKMKINWGRKERDLLP